MSRTTRRALGGTAVLAAVAAYEYASRGPESFRAQYRTRRQAAPLTPPPAPGDDVTERDLGRLPEPVATYVRRAGAVGQPRVTHLELNLHGRIRSGPNARG